MEASYNPESKEILLSLEQFAILKVSNAFQIEHDRNQHLFLTHNDVYSWVWDMIRKIKLRKDQTEIKTDDQLVDEIKIELNNEDDLVRELIVRRKKRYIKYISQELRTMKLRGLIKSEVYKGLNGSSIIILGIVPVSFTKRTEKGEDLYNQVYQAIKTHEDKNNYEDSPYHYHWRFSKIWEATKEILVDI